MIFMNKAEEVEIGKVWDNKFGPFRVIEDNGVENHIHYVTIQFLKLNMFGFYTQRKVQLSAVKQREISDWYQPTLCNGYACKGDARGKGSKDGNNTREYNLWSNMIKRCYNKNDNQY